MSLIDTIILAIIEGLTEYLPISSTGHLIIGQSLLGIPSDDFTKTFIVAIQFGAILAVLVLYAKRFLHSAGFYLRLLTAFLPAAIAGLLLAGWIDALLESVVTVSITLILGGVIFLWIDRWFTHKGEHPVLPTYKSSFLIGLFQTLALVPGVSRAAASIIGGLQQGLTRQAAAEFSFFLAVPTLSAAAGYKLLKFYLHGEGFAGEQIKVLIIGNIVAFAVAMLAIKFFIAYISRRGFRLFGYYRISVGFIILLLYAFGVIDAHAL